MGGKFGCLVVNQVTKTFKRLELGRFNLFGEAFDLPEIRNRVSGRRNKKKRGLSVWLDFQRERSGELGVLTEGAQAGETAEVLAMLCKDRTFEPFLLASTKDMASTRSRVELSLLPQFSPSALQSW